ncbi:DUF2179 domain-containing protein [Phocicoccus pinnipedialis]|uniref:UPF0316 protein JEOPIN946_00785 n=1 Tax=Phocicoccus pinnipedialis TaxID=110845 RepID=A0A6V7R9A1_9BACL|nr:DUF2179 domain-containing protein [Jeotgalicoccus pinnipedialis]MBP1940205.1 uncharacterized protein YebE (UPF0316 family) [Jeotgalicoccus pinnipedialis]CAD2074009.1 hypothetical protein JEOPIN946_00785 [Jeotgalicoccus pinnipedialis]
MLQAISENQWLMLLTIFVINIAYVSFLTMRTISTLKGYRYVAASLSVCETFIYIMGLGLVLDNLDKPQNIAAYAFGFGIGILLGIKIEEKLALGYLVVNVITAEKDKDMPMMLRDLGYGVTHGQQYGRDGERTTMQILTPRRYEKKLIATIKELDPKAFIISYEPRTIHGGFWTRGVRSRKVEQYDVDHVEEVLDEISAEGTSNVK